MPRDASLVPGDLYALHVKGEPLISDPEKLPTRMVVFPWGDNESTKGLFRVNEVTLSALPINQKLTGFERVCIDFNHNTVPGTEFYKGEPCEVAAYADVLCVENEGIVYDNIDWTPAGRKFIGDGHYRDLSPAPKKDAQGNVIFLHSVAACRQGAVTDLILLSADYSTTNPPPKTKHTMDPKKLLCAILGLDPEKATDEEIEAAAQKAADDAKTPAEKTEAPTALTALAAEVKNLHLLITGDRKAREDSERQGIIALAAGEGKVVPKGAEKLDIADLKTLCADLPVTVPLGKRTTATALSADPAIVQGADAEVIKGLGITEDAFKKHNAAK